MRRTRVTRTRLAGTAGVGAGIAMLVTYFFDPQSGRRRRHVAADRFVAFFRRRFRRAARAARLSASYSQGLTQRAVHVREQRKPDMDDVTLARKVETELFRDANVPKGQINVNVENGVVYLRGEVETEGLMDLLERKARKVHEAKRVENLMHLPGQPAPTHV